MAAEFEGADLKDPRRVERLAAVVAAQNGKKMRGEETAKLKNKEYERWFRNVEASAENLSGVDDVVHVMDAEGDSYKLLENMNRGGHRFVVRLCHDRVAKAVGDDSWGRLGSVIEGAKEFKRTREVQVSRRKPNRRPGSRKGRPARTAKLTFAFERVVFKRPAYLTDDDAEPSLELNAEGAGDSPDCANGDTTSEPRLQQRRTQSPRSESKKHQGSL